jgi:hypothetical protein
LQASSVIYEPMMRRDANMNTGPIKEENVSISMR